MHKYSFSLATKFFPDCGMTCITGFFSITVCQRNFFVRNEEFFKIFASENIATYWYMGMTETGSVYFIFGKKECSLVSDISGYLSILLFFPQNVYLHWIWYQKGSELNHKKASGLSTQWRCLIDMSDNHPPFPPCTKQPSICWMQNKPKKHVSPASPQLESPPLTPSITLTHLSYADIIQCNNMFTHWSALTCWVDGRRLLRLQNKLEMMASTRDELSSESGSNVFSPFSLKDSMMFQMSTRDTENNNGNTVKLV